MNNIFKKIAAAAGAIVIATSLGGCMVENGYIMKVDGMNIRSGVYLSLLQTSFGNASARLEELSEGNDDTSTDGTSSDEDYDIFSETIDGKSFSDWVKDDARGGVLRFVGIQRQCEEFGITLTEEELNEINASVSDTWNVENYYLQMLYGINTMGEYYESMGIGEESYKELAIVDALNAKLFMHYYGEGGELAPSSDELNSYIDENYAAYRLITLQYVDYAGNPLIADEEYQEVKDRAKEYADRINGGESFADVFYDYALKSAKDKARADAEESYSELLEAGLIDEGVTEEDYILDAVDSVTVEDDLDGAIDEYYDEVISKEGSPLSDELTDYIFGAVSDGKATVFEGKTSAYVVVKLKMEDMNTWKEDHLETVLRLFKGDAFDGMMDILCQNYDVSQNDYLINKKYSPEKLY